MRKRSLSLGIVSFTIIMFWAAMLPGQELLSLKEQAKLEDEILTTRITQLLQDLMKEADIDLWLLIAREYNDDPVMRTLLPATWPTARRRTILVIYKNPKSGELETLAVARYDVGSIFKRSWDPEQEPDQWKRLIALIKERDPGKIGINKSRNYNHADGISATDHELLMEYLPSKYKSRVVSAESLAVRWLETRIEKELTLYNGMMRWAHDIIAEGLSEKVIHPGVTTTEDLIWWYRQQMSQRGLPAWFQPTVEIQRPLDQSGEERTSFSSRPPPGTIMPGDLINIDFGFTYLNLNTDTQQMAYVLKHDEASVPDYLTTAYARGIRAMDILTSQFKTGRPGNQILKAALDQCKNEGLNATIYSHPLGYHGHGAGPTIGMWDAQGGVPGPGDWALYPNTAYAIELNVKVFIEEWNREIRIMIEQDAWFDGEKVHYIDGRQTQLLPIPRPQPHLGK